MRGRREYVLPTPAGAKALAVPRSDWPTLKRLFPYLWAYRGRVLLALAFMIGAKLANVGVPLLLKELVDAMALAANDPRSLAVVPAALLLAYGALRLSSTLFTELRELVFA
jgi:ATP-binding cassette subfamily B protein